MIKIKIKNKKNKDKVKKIIHGKLGSNDEIIKKPMQKIKKKRIKTNLRLTLKI
jgi:hypothetical protein